MTNNEISNFISNGTDFKDKAGYLAWRNEWRTIYSELSVDIRTLRGNVAETLRREDYAGNLQSNSVSKSVLAFQMLELRAESKVKAEENYLTFINKALETA